MCKDKLNKIFPKDNPVDVEVIELIALTKGFFNFAFITSVEGS